MVEWFSKAIDWIMVHYKGITTFVTSAQFVMIASLVVLLVKQIRKVITNTNTTNLLRGEIFELKKIQENSLEVKREVELLRTENAELKEQVMLMSKQFNLFYEAQSIVYSTHKNEDTRANLMRIVGKAKTLSREETAKENVDKTVEVKKPVKKVKAKEVPIVETETARY